MTLVATFVMLAEDVTFMNNRRQWEKLPAATLIQKGSDFMVKNFPDSAMLCYSIVANRYNENLQGDELKSTIRAHCWIGNIYINLFVNYAEGYKYLLKAQDLAEKHHYDDFLPNIFSSLGNFYWLQSGFKRVDQFDKEALDYHKKSFWKTIEIKKYDEIPTDLINLIYIAFETGELMQIATEREIYSRLPIPDSSGLKFAAEAMNEGVELFSKGHLEQALESFRHALSESKTSSSFNTESLQVMFDMCIYKTLLQLSRDDDALAILKQAKEVVENNLPEVIPGIYEELAKYYIRQHNQALADQYELLWRRSTDSIAQASQASNVATVRFLYEIDKMNEEQKAQAIKQQHYKQLLWIVSAAALVAIVMLVLLYYSRKRIQEGYQRLYKQNVELLAAEDARQQEARAEQPKEKVVEAPKYSHNQMDDEVMDELWQQIVNILQTNEEIYQDSFDVEQLCEMLGAKRAYVSQTINTKTGDSFTALLNDYRIREACRRMNDTTNYGQYTVEGIANSIGYSRSYFVRIFKEATGVPPSAYMKLAKAGNADFPNADLHDSHPDIN
jgi:YesN/AraC family two-component response regulator